MTPEGLPLAYEVLPGNTADKTTLRGFLDRIERQYGKARRVWLMDRGVPTEEVLAEMRAADPPVHYLVGTPKRRLTRLENHLVAPPWPEARPGVQSLPRRRPGSNYWRSRARSTSWRNAVTASPRACPGEGRGAGDPSAAAEAAVGPAQAALHHAVDARGTADEARRRARSVPHGRAPGRHRGRRRQRYIQLSARSQQTAASPIARRAISAAHQPRRERPGQAVEPLSVVGRRRGGVQEPPEPAPAKAGGDLAIRPVFHQLEARIEAPVFIAFLAYCLQVTLARRLHALAPGPTPRSVLEKFAAMQMIDVPLPTTDRRELGLTRYTEPEPELSLLLNS